MNRSSASVGLACLVAVSVGVLSGCQNSPTSTSPTASAAPVAELAAKVPEKMRSEGVMTVGIDPNYPPMEFLQRGEAVGADLDLMTAVGQKLGLRVQFAEDAYALLVPGVAAGRFDAAISALSVDDNDLQNANMITYFSAGSQLAVRPPAKKRFGPRNLCGRKITVLDGSVQYSQLVAASANCVEAQKKAIRILTFPSQEPATQAVIDGQAYGTLADSPAIQSAVENSNGALVPNGRRFEVAPYGIAVAPERKQLGEAVQAALESMIEDGTYQQILDSWNIADGGIEQPEILTRKDIPEPTPLPSITPVTPSPTLVP